MDSGKNNMARQQEAATRSLSATIAELVTASAMSQPELLAIASACLSQLATCPPAHTANSSPIHPRRLSQLAQGGYGRAAGYTESGTFSHSPARPEAVVEQQELEQEAASRRKAAEAELTAGQWEVWQPFYYERKSFDDIAAELAPLTPRAVRDRLARVKKVMRRHGLRLEMLDVEHERPAMSRLEATERHAPDGRAVVNTGTVETTADGMVQHEGIAESWGVKQQNDSGHYNHRDKEAADHKQQKVLLHLEALTAPNPADRVVALRRQVGVLKRETNRATLRQEHATVYGLRIGLAALEERIAKALAEASTTETPDVSATFTGHAAQVKSAQAIAGAIASAPTTVGIPETTTCGCNTWQLRAPPTADCSWPEVHAKKHAELLPVLEHVGAAQGHVLDTRKPWHGEGSSRRGQTLRHAAVTAARQRAAVAGRRSSLTSAQIAELRDRLNERLVALHEEQQRTYRVLQESSAVGAILEDSISVEAAADAMQGAELIVQDIPRKMAAVKQALTRLEHSVYGFCHDCSTEISCGRLQLVPETLYCGNCVGKREDRKHLRQVKDGETQEGFIRRDLTPGDGGEMRVDPKDRDEWREW